MAVLFSDNFNTGTEPNTTNWTENGTWSLTGGAARCTAATTPGVLLTTASAHTATADVKVSCAQVATGSSDGGPCARWTGNGASSTGYAADAYGSVIEIYRHNASAAGTLIGSGAAITRSAGSVVAIEVSGTGATVTLKSYYGGTLRETASDTAANRLTTADRTGIYNWFPSSTTAADYDDFQAEDLAAGGRTTKNTRAWALGTQVGMGHRMAS
jgi:hypothetical protein